MAEVTRRDVLATTNQALCAIENEIDHQAWDDFLVRAPGGELVQSSAWGDFKRASGMEIHRLVVRADDDTIVGGAQVIVRRFSLLGAAAYVPYGPVVDPCAPDDTAAMLAEALACYTRRIAVRALFVQPPDGGERTAAALRAAGFEASATTVAPSASMRIDLRREPSEILDCMRGHTKRDVKRSWREPVWVRFGTRDDLDSFYDLYCCTASRQRFRPLPRAYFDSLWDHLSPSGSVRLLLADVNGTDVAGNVVSCFGDVVTGRFLGFDPSRLPKRLRPTEALVWGYLSWARASGYGYLDVGGVDRTEALKMARASDVGAVSEDAIRRFRFGGEPVVYPEPLKMIHSRVLRAGLRARNINRVIHHVRPSLERRARGGKSGAYQSTG
jgi:lipid II:glycine glycyltransferase (peptidoglycan interpeptide bridge formation enzyme)